MSIPDAAKTNRVVHLTSVHRRYDVRIFQKECGSLHDAGYEVVLVVADGRGDETAANGVRIVDVGKPGGRLERMLRTTWKVGGAGLSLDGDIYHCHDPELLPVAMWLKSRGRTVIFDSHEDVPKQIVSKAYLPQPTKAPVAAAVAWIEGQAAHRLDAVVAATPSIADKFEDGGARVCTVSNYPILGEFGGVPAARKKSRICYVGGISEARGIVPLIEALALCRSEIRLELLGEFSEGELERRVHDMAGWHKVDARGFVDRAAIRSILGDCFVGLCTLLPYPNHVEALPIKMFEYMSAGLPVIVSDFPLWRSIVVDNECGICVDPEDAQAIATAIERLATDPELAERMGRNGRAEVERQFSWEREREKLVDLYGQLVK